MYKLTQLTLRWIRYGMPHLRRFCSKADHQRQIFCEALHSRKLVRVSGKETLSFLQGMITNDTKHLSVDPQQSVRMSSMFAMMLNSVGRVLYDFILYKPDAQRDDELFLECDADARNSVLRLLNLYKLRKDVHFEAYDDAFVWAVFHPFCSGVDEPIGPEASINVMGEFKMNVRDPRLHLLGQRVLLDSKQDLTTANPSFQKCEHETESDYVKLRYQLGVNEGLRELPTANCFPLECNADYLSGLSFHKGCYIGQELTARTHHTGVVRKRVMPVVLLDHADTQIPVDTVVRDENDKAVGKLRVHQGQVGLALLRVDEALKALQLTAGTLRLSTVKPGWWPMEASKKHLEIQRS